MIKKNLTLFGVGAWATPGSVQAGLTKSAACKPSSLPINLSLQEYFDKVNDFFNN